MKAAYLLLALSTCSHEHVTQGVVRDRLRSEGWTQMQRVGDETVYTEMPPTYRLRVEVGRSSKDFQVSESLWTQAFVGSSVGVRSRYVGCLSSEDVVLR